MVKSYNKETLVALISDYLFEDILCKYYQNPLLALESLIKYGSNFNLGVDNWSDEELIKTYRKYTGMKITISEDRLSPIIKEERKTVMLRENVIDELISYIIMNDATEDELDMSIREGVKTFSDFTNSELEIEYENWFNKKIRINE